MKRPLATVGFLYVFVQLVAVVTGDAVSFGIAIGALCLFGVSVLFLKKGKSMAIPFSFLLVFVSAAATAVELRYVAEPPRALGERNAQVVAYVSELPTQGNGKYYYVFQTEAVVPLAEDERKEPLFPRQFQFRLSSSTPLELELYQRAEMTVGFIAPEEGEAYSSQQYYQAKGIYLFAYLKKYEIRQLPDKPRDFAYFILQMRMALVNKIGELLPEKQAALVKGIVMGDKSAISPEVLEAFQASGIRHLLAVSGLHTAFFSQLLLGLLSLLHLPGKLKYGFTAAGVLGFMTLTGFTPSVTRAGIMCVVYLLGQAFFRQADSLNSLGLAGLVLCLANPCAAGDVGFQLSFLATLGIVLFTGKIKEKICGFISLLYHPRRLSLGIAATVAMSLSAMVFTLPVLALSFGQISVAAPLVNIFAILPAQFLMSSALLALLFSFLGPLAFLARPLALFAGILANYLMDCAEWFAGIPHALLPVSSNFFQLWLSLELLLAALAVALYRPQRKACVRVTALLSVITLLVGSLSYQMADKGAATIGVVACGNGLTVCVGSGKNTVVLTAGGSKMTPQNCENYLLQWGCENPDILFLPDNDRQSVLTAARLLRTKTPRALWMREEKTVPDEIEKHLGTCCQLVQEARPVCVKLSDSLSISSIHTEDGVWYNIKAGQQKILIAMKGADAGSLPKEYRTPDLLVLSQLPERWELLRAGTVILSNDDRGEQQMLLSCARLAPYVYTTAQNGDMTFYVRQNGKAQLRPGG